MEFLLEALAEAIFQLIFEVIIASIDFALAALFGTKVVSKVRIVASLIFYIFIGASGGWVSVKIHPVSIGGGTPQPWISLLVLPLIVGASLFFFTKRAFQKKGTNSLVVVALYCGSLTWAFSIARYMFL